MVLLRKGGMAEKRWYWLRKGGIAEKEVVLLKKKRWYC